METTHNVTFARTMTAVTRDAASTDVDQSTYTPLIIINLLTAEFSFKNPLRGAPVKRSNDEQRVDHRVNAPIINFTKRVKQNGQGLHFYSIKNPRFVVGKSYRY